MPPKNLKKRLLAQYQEDQKKKKPKKEKVDSAAFAPMPESEEEWVSSLVKNLEVEKNEQR